jgi:hypothetical protein
VPLSPFPPSFAQAERPHVGPDFLNVGQALLFGTAFAGIVPSQRIFPLRRPDGILFFVVYHSLVDGFVFSFITIHSFSMQVHCCVKF